MGIFKRNLKLELMKKCKQVVLKKLSVENIIDKDFKIDKLAEMLLSQEQLKKYESESKIIIYHEISNLLTKKYSGLKEISGLSEYNKSNFNLKIGTKYDDATSKPIKNSC